ncbi:MAG: hypothetical protein ACI87E_000853 [Mariniblastus sp.]|jgi:hypothetical protein
MESDNRLPTGEWNGFFVESHKSQRGWMHLYLSFADGKIKGEGTDYVGPWISQGEYDLRSGTCAWVKQYLGLHQINYTGKIGENGIVGHWGFHISENFHIWPKAMTHLNELYLSEDLEQPAPTMQLGTAIVEDFRSLA